MGYRYHKIQFEYSNTDTLSNIEYSNSDTNGCEPYKWIRCRRLSESIRTLFTALSNAYARGLAKQARSGLDHRLICRPYFVLVHGPKPVNVWVCEPVCTAAANGIRFCWEVILPFFSLSLPISFFSVNCSIPPTFLRFFSLEFTHVS